MKKNSDKTNKALETPGYPLSTSEMRDLTLKAAGFDPEVIGAYMRKSALKLHEKLSATKVEFFSKDGVVVDERVVEDNASQLKAAQALLELGISTMALNRKSPEDKVSTPDITIDLSGWTIKADGEKVVSSVIEVIPNEP